MANTPRFGRETARRRYVVGFAFNPSRSRVALIRKKRGPEGADMVGTWNGIGGGAQPGETYAQAMRREFFKEAGPTVTHWEPYAIIEGDDWRLFVYRATLTAWQWRRIRCGTQSVTDEHVRRVSAARLPRAIFHDVSWLVPLALDRGPRAVARIDYRSI